MTEWQSVVAVVAGTLIALLTHRLWLPSLLDILRGNRIEAVWANKKYSLSVSAAQNAIKQQESALLDDLWGAASTLMSIPSVRKVELVPKLVGGWVTGELAFRATVAKKRPLHELPHDQVIPSYIGQVPKDVVEGLKSR